MRSTSRRPCRSNRQSSTLSALAENSAKLVPRPSQVAPSGCGSPDESRNLPVRNEENCSQGRNNKIDLGNHPLVQRPNYTAVPDIAATVERRIGVEDLAPHAGKRHPHTVVAVDLRREIDHHQATILGMASFTQPREHTAVMIVHHEPFEPGALAIKLTQSRYAAIEAVEIADERLHSPVTRLAQQMPVQGVIVAPFAVLREFAPHEQ